MKSLTSDRGCRCVSCTGSIMSCIPHRGIVAKSTNKSGTAKNEKNITSSENSFWANGRIKVATAIVIAMAKSRLSWYHGCCRNPFLQRLEMRLHSGRFVHFANPSLASNEFLLDSMTDCAMGIRSGWAWVVLGFPPGPSCWYKVGCRLWRDSICDEQLQSQGAFFSGKAYLFWTISVCRSQHSWARIKIYNLESRAHQKVPHRPEGQGLKEIGQAPFDRKSKCFLSHRFCRQPYDRHQTFLYSSNGVYIGAEGYPISKISVTTKSIICQCPVLMLMYDKYIIHTPKAWERAKSSEHCADTKRARLIMITGRKRAWTQ